MRLLEHDLLRRPPHVLFDHRSWAHSSSWSSQAASNVFVNFACHLGDCSTHSKMRRGNHDRARRRDQRAITGQLSDKCPAASPHGPTDVATCIDIQNPRDKLE